MNEAVVQTSEDRRPGGNDPKDVARRIEYGKRKAAEERARIATEENIRLQERIHILEAQAKRPQQPAPTKGEPVLSKPVGFLLDRRNPVDWSLFGDYLVRVRKFCTRYDPETDVDVLLDQLMQDFARDDRVFATGVVLVGEQLVGHGLISLERWGYKKVAVVLQMELDDGTGIPPESLQSFTDQLEHWARLNGCTGVHAFVKNEAHQRRLEMFHGFNRFKILLRKELSK